MIFIQRPRRYKKYYYHVYSGICYICVERKNALHNSRIIDRTMACIDGVSQANPSVLRFRELLGCMGVNVVEDNNTDTPTDRIYGYDDALCGDYRQTFLSLKKLYGDTVEFCPGNKYYCATALAVEWLTYGNGGNVVTSFCGIDGGAATEEVIMALRVMGMRGADETYEFLPETTKLFREITGKGVRATKPVIGRGIFDVESGVHVDGILKHPACYEPFPPETVGLSRKIVLGKQSGTASIRAKLSEHNIVCDDDGLVKRILEQVKAKALEKNGAVTDREFKRIIKEYQQ